MSTNQGQNPIPNGHYVASSNVSQRAGRTSFLPKKVESPVSCVSSSIPQGITSTGNRANDIKQAIDTPIRTFLSSNITPRSSSRKARAESASSTPNGTPGGTPSNSRPLSMVYSFEKETEYSGENASPETRRLSIGRKARSSSISSDRPSTALSFRSASKERGLHSANSLNAPNNSKFFHADDVRPALASIPSERMIEQGMANGFANYQGRDDTRTSRAFLGSSPPADELRPKFLYANGMAESTPVLKSPPSRAMRTPYPIHTGTSPTASSGPRQQRATSPLKEEIVSRKSSLSKPRRHKRLVSNPNVALELDVQSPESMSIGQSNISRRSSVKSPDTPQVCHARSSVVGAVTPNPAGSESISWSGSPIVDSPKTSVIAEPESFEQKDQIVASTIQENLPAPAIGKPTLGQSKIDQMNELAANARRERKVLDLEISNSSLLAINRTLEREMRKQNAELRRFRRRSQGGRLSAIPASRSTSHALSILSKSDQDGNDSDDLSERSSPSIAIDDDDEEDSSDDSSKQSAHFLHTSRIARLRIKDATPVPLDHARHRELLVDSQKLNESIRRCLDRTEDLIKDGKKALEYHVQIGGVETHGGRVLMPDEIEDGEIGEQRQGLLSPGVSNRRGMDWEFGEGKKEEDEEEKDEMADEDFPEGPDGDETGAFETDTALSLDNHATDPIDPEQLIAKPSEPPIPLASSPPTTSEFIPEQTPTKSDPPLPPDEPLPPPPSAPPLPPTTVTVSGSVQGIKDYLANLGPAWGL